MSGFAAAYQNEANDAWLNSVLNDILAHPVSAGSCITAGRDWDDDLVDADDHGNPLASPSRPDGLHEATHPQLPVPSRQSSLRSGHHRHRSSLGGNGAHFAVTWPRTRPNRSHLRIISTPGTLHSPMPSMSSSHKRDSGSLTLAESYCEGHSLKEEVSTTSRPNLEKRMSNISEVSAFQPHPAVRPLYDNRKSLGEAAGRTDDDAQEYPRPLALSLIILGICLAVFIISLDRNIIATAIPRITAQFHSYNDIGWYGSSYLLTASAFQPLYGRIYVMCNSKTTYISSLAIFELGSLLCGVAPSSTALIVGRAVQGLGSAGVLTGSFVIGTHAVPLHQRPILFAGVGVLFGAGALIGPLLGGLFTDLATWRWCFYVNLPCGGVTLLAVLLFFHPKRIQKDQQPWLQRILQLDIVGNILLLGASIMLFIALELSEQRDSFSSAPVIGLLCGFGVTVVVFIAWMWYKGDAALIPPRIVRQRTVAASCVAAFCIYGALLIHAYYLPIWFQAIKGATAIQSGRNMIPYMLANALFSLAAGIFVSKRGVFAPPAILGCAIGTVGAGLITAFSPSSNSAHWIGFEVLTSAGLGMAVQQGFSAVQTALPLEDVPLGTAAVVASQSLGGAVMVAVGNTILQDYLLDANRDAKVPGVDVRLVVRLGATAFRQVVPKDKLPALLALYNGGLVKVFVAATVMCGAAFVASLGMEWKSVRRELGPDGSRVAAARSPEMEEEGRLVSAE